MGGARPVEGGRALLFERLVDLEPGRGEAAPFLLHDRDGLKASVAFELERLLSTRAPLAAEAMAGRERTTIDYGIPDWAVVSPGDGQSRTRFAAQIAEAVRAYEPRLAEPKVTLRQVPERGDALVCEISGLLAIGSLMEPVSFALALDGGGSADMSDGG